MSSQEHKHQQTTISTTSIEAPPDRTLTAKHLRRYKTGYFLSTLSLGPAFAGFGTYVTFQLQTIAYVIGHELGAARGTGCPPTAPACLVTFGSQEVNLTSYLLYLNALCFAISGALVLVVSGIGDRFSFQREQYVLMLVIYGALCLPVAGLKAMTEKTFTTFAVLYVLSNVVGFVASAWSNIFVPYAMQETPSVNASEGGEATSEIPPGPPNAGQLDDHHHTLGKHSRRQKEQSGLSMSAWGWNGLNVGQLTIYVIVFGLTYVNSLYVGLYTTTTAGALCIVLVLASWQLLPSPVRQHDNAPTTMAGWLGLPFQALRTLYQGLLVYREAFKYLIAFTIYNDTLFAFTTVSGQLFNLSIRPSLREFTAYTLGGPVVGMVCATLLLFGYSPLLKYGKVTLRHWTIISYAVFTFATVWSCIGVSSAAKIGLKHRWEFYFIQVLVQISFSVSNVAFRVLLPQMFPRGNEVQYFGFQQAISLATVWIPQVVNAPVVDATNNLRVPAIVSAVFGLIAVGLAVWTDEEAGMKQVKANGQASAMG
ncbi:hypothetical protein LTR78_007781 [Recurvomyces mirabilis]|uniref:Autophagy-related protein n=1 Tax=Recurvomyces mirabilis TaxID=574656 RepID=A0AAE0WJ62_9PEZI|nr:hypothetical protein LTR78_007781 [Recurvomyces mirabilis]KAK5160176.1 hypothetical protein LTS14_002283 [Recurvomyces mirabilis]